MVQMTDIAVVAIAYITIPVEIHEFDLSHNLDTFFDINTTKLNLLKLSNSTQSQSFECVSKIYSTKTFVSFHKLAPQIRLNCYQKHF